MTADIDADTTGNRTSDTCSSLMPPTTTMTTASTTTDQTINNTNFISATSSISVSNAVSKIDALLNASNGGIGANFPRNNGRKLKPIITMPSIEVSTSVADMTVTSDVTSDCSSDIPPISMTAPLPPKKPNANMNTAISLYQRDVSSVDTTTTTTAEITIAETNDIKSIGDADRNHHHHHTDDDAHSMTMSRQENNYAVSRSQLGRPDNNQYLAIPSTKQSSSSVNNNKNQTQHIHHHHHHHHQHKQLSPTQKGKRNRH